MTKTDTTPANQPLPLFAQLLERTEAQTTTGGGTRPAPTYHCLDSYCTKKYPSDQDDSDSYGN
jgi:hypothetical protein